MCMYSVHGRTYHSIYVSVAIVDVDHMRDLPHLGGGDGARGVVALETLVHGAELPILLEWPHKTHTQTQT